MSFCILKQERKTRVAHIRIMKNSTWLENRCNCVKRSRRIITALADLFAFLKKRLSSTLKVLFIP